MSRDLCNLISRLVDVLQVADSAMGDAVSTLDCGEPIQCNSDHYVAFRKAVVEIQKVIGEVEGIS